MVKNIALKDSTNFLGSMLARLPIFAINLSNRYCRRKPNRKFMLVVIINSRSWRDCFKILMSKLYRPIWVAAILLYDSISGAECTCFCFHYEICLTRDCRIFVILFFDVYNFWKLSRNPWSRLSSKTLLKSFLFFPEKGKKFDILKQNVIFYI